MADRPRITLKVEVTKNMIGMVAKEFSRIDV